MNYGDCPGPLAVAHRGGAGLAAENTLDAFGRSHALGVRYLETDVRLTRDGGLVAFHDASVDRVTARCGRVRSLTTAQLTSTPVLGGAADNTTVVTLGRLLATFPHTCFTVDLKDRQAIEPLAELLLTTGSAGRVCVAAARGSWVRALAALVGPEMRTALSWRALARLVSPRTGGRFDGSGFAHVPLHLGRLPVFRDDLLARAHDAGIRVLVWTVNEPDTMHRLLDSGVDGIITDRPDRLREVLVARGQWHSPDSHGAVSDLIG